MTDIVLATIEETCVVLNFSAPDFARLTPGHQSALRFYAAHKEEMDRGATLLDPQRLPLHKIYYDKAVKGDLYFDCELQNAPPAEKNQKSLQLEVDYLLARRFADHPRGVVPAWASFIVVAIDIGAYGLHWEADAFSVDGTSCLIDQGLKETNLNAGGEYRMTDDEKLKHAMVDRAVLEALQALRLQLADGWPRASGEMLAPALIGVDCGGTAETFAWYETVLRFCANAPRWIPLKGEKWSRSIADRAMGRNWICEITATNHGRRHDCNADEYKMRVARAYELPVRSKDGNIHPGARIYHKETPTLYCRHQTAERWIETIAEGAVSGKELKLGWYKNPGMPNHFWDTAWMANALADIYGVLRGQTPAPRDPPRGPRPNPAMPMIPQEFQRERF